MWLCVLTGTAVLFAGAWAAMKLYGHWAIRREEADRERLQQEWKRRAAERKAKGQGTLPEDEPYADDPRTTPLE